MPNPFDIGKNLINTLATPKSRVNVDAFNKIPPEPTIANSLHNAPNSVVPGSFKLNDYGGIGNFTRNAQDADIYNQKNKLPGDQNQWANSVPVVKNPRIAYRTGPAFLPPSAIKQMDDSWAGSDLMSDNFNWLPGGTLTKAAPNGAIVVPP